MAPRLDLAFFAQDVIHEGRGITSAKNIAGSTVDADGFPMQVSLSLVITASGDTEDQDRDWLLSIELRNVDTNTVIEGYDLEVKFGHHPDPLIPPRVTAVRDYELIVDRPTHIRARVLHDFQELASVPIAIVLRE